VLIDEPKLSVSFKLAGKHAIVCLVYVLLINVMLLAKVFVAACCRRRPHLEKQTGPPSVSYGSWPLALGPFVAQANK
jgi:hypothetical protein